MHLAAADDVARSLLIRLASGHVASAAIYVVLELGVADRLANGARSVDVLANETGANEDALYRVLRALASVGVFSEEMPRTFALTRPAALLRSDRGAIQDQLRWMAHPLQLRASANAMYSVRTGAATLEQIARHELFDLLANDAGLAGCFHDAMTAASTEIMAGVLDVYDFSDVQVLVDIGGSHGQALSLVLQKYPRMSGVLFDRADVVARAAAHLGAAGVADRCRIQAGDFFVSVPTDGDAYLLKHIVHDWDDEPARAILTQVRRALDHRKRGRAILIESPIATGNRPDPTKFSDLTMLLSVGGRERTVDEYRALCSSAGLVLTQAILSKTGAFVLEARST